MPKYRYLLSVVTMIWIITITSESQRPAPHANQRQNQTMVVQIERGTAGEVWVSLTAHQRSSLEILLQLTRQLGCELAVAPKWRQQLQKQQLTVVLKKRKLEQVLQSLTGAGQCHYQFHAGKLTLFGRERPASPSEVVAGYKKLLLSSSDPERLPLIYFSLGALFYLKNKPRLALREYNTLLHQHPDSQLLPAALLLMARCSLQTREYQRAIKILTMFFDRFSSSSFQVHAFMLLAQCYEKQGKWDNSRRIYEYLLAQNKHRDKAAVKIKLARMLQKQENYPAAVAVWEELLTEVPPKERAQVIYAKIHCYLALQQKQAAQHSFWQFYHEMPQHPLAAEVKLLHAHSLFQDGDYFKSYYLANGLIIEKDQKIATTAAVLAAKALVAIGAILPGISVLQKAAAHAADEENRIVLWRQMAAICHQAKRWHQAQELWRQLATSIGDIAYLKILECDYRSGNYRQCLQNFQAFQRKIKSKSRLSEAYYLAGKSYEHLGEIAKALEAFQGISRQKGQ